MVRDTVVFAFTSLPSLTSFCYCCYIQATTILSTGKRKKVASRVFGDSVDLETSLCYTPSPGGPSSASKSFPLAVAEGVISSDITCINEVENEDESTTPQPTVLFQQKQQITASTAGMRVSFAAEQKENRDNVDYGDENYNNNSRLSSSKVAATLKSVRDAELNRLRATARSPKRQALAQKTADVVNDTTSNIQRSKLSEENNRIMLVIKKNSSNMTAASVNQSLNAIRKAKMDVTRDKTRAVKSVRFQWERENTEAKTLYDRVEENRRQIRAIQRQLSSAHFKEKAVNDDTQKMERFVKLEQEYKFNSDVFREHQQTLKVERDRDRRNSTDARAMIRRNKREGEEKLKQRKLEEDEACFDVRSDLHRARMEASRANAEARRKSFQFRAGDARRIRGMRAVWREKELHERHESFELSRAAAKDVANYKKNVAKELRENIRVSNVDARNGRQREEEQAYDAMIAEHASYELKWAGERDARAYQKTMKEERRKSLAGRNKESVRHAKVMEELRCIAREKEAESYMLKFAGERDAKAYLVRLAEERRQSLQLRGKESRKARRYEEEERAKAVQESIADGVLRSECEYDAFSI
jgi:hypothetical protein